jgi:hypothetical protein
MSHVCDTFSPHIFGTKNPLVPFLQEEIRYEKRLPMHNNEAQQTDGWLPKFEFNS